MRTGDHTAAYNAKNQTTGIDTSTYTYADADAGQGQRNADSSANTCTNWIGGLFQTNHTGPTSQVTYIRLPSGLLVAATNNGRYLYHPDLVTRNINMITDSTGNAVATYTYDPYGTTTAATGTYAATNVMRYQASQQDSTGLYRFGDRYYDPTTQQWTQQDTFTGNFSNPTTTDRYNYAGSNPIANADPTGRSFWDSAVETVTAGVGGIIGVGVGGFFGDVPGAVIGGCVGGALGYEAGVQITGDQSQAQDAGLACIGGVVGAFFV